MKHGNMAGSSEHGGVLCIAGDDHGASTHTHTFSGIFGVCRHLARSVEIDRFHVT